ncbi:MAG: ABC transporter permease subunit [Planctomycetaceae bacterium]
MALRIPELPLLRRELIELANRKRTYVVRVVGAVVLLFMVFTAYSVAVTEWVSNSGLFGVSGSNRYFGIGGPVFVRIVPLLFYAIQLLLPALCCASITMEKERNTIGTLFLTRLSPWTIVFEKMLSRIIPMLTILLLAAPVLAYVYSLGGVDTELLIATFWLLTCECLLFASIAMMCSSFFATTVSAFIWSYSLIAVLGLLSASMGLITFVPSVIWQQMSVQGMQAMLWQRSGGPLGLFPPAGGAVGGSSIPALAFVLLRSSLPSLIVTAICLSMARSFLIRRAFVSTSSVLLRVFKSVDRFFTRLNDATTGGIEIIPDSSPLPVNDPVAWRERNKKSLGKARYLFRILLCLEGPTLFICTAAASTSARSAFEGLYYLHAILWALAAMITSVKAATLFSSERARETLEPLLATPLTSVELLRQKVAGMKRLLIVIALPILTVNFTQVLLRVNLDPATLRSPLILAHPLVYFLLSIMAVWILLYLTTWLCAGIGLRIQSQTKAVLVAVAVMALWSVLPIAVGPIFPFLRELLLFLSPASCIYLLEIYLMRGSLFTTPVLYGRETGLLDSLPMIIPVVICLSYYAGVALGLRFLVRRGAPRLLNRLESPKTVASPAWRQDVIEGNAMPVAEGS